MMKDEALKIPKTMQSSRARGKKLNEAKVWLDGTVYFILDRDGIHLRSIHSDDFRLEIGWAGLVGAALRRGIRVPT